MVPDRQESKRELKRSGVRQLVPTNWGYVQVQPASEERNEWKGWKEKKRDERNNYHRTE
jgi:hypothetical protein